MPLAPHLTLHVSSSGQAKGHSESKLFVKLLHITFRADSKGSAAVDSMRRPALS